MKKIIVALGLAAVLLGAGAPFINGCVVEQIVIDAVDNINKANADSGSDVKIVINNYDKSFTSSTIEWKLDLGAMSAFFGVNEIIFLETAKHGYTNVVSETSLEKNQWYADFVKNKLDGKDPVHINTTYTLAGDIASVIKTDKISLKNGNDSAMIMPLEAQISIDKGLTRVDSIFDWGGAQVLDLFDIGSVNASSRMNRISTYIWAGNLDFEVDRATGQNKSSMIDIAGISGSSILDYDAGNHMVSIAMECGLGRLAENRFEQIKDASVRVAFNNVDAKAYEGIMKLYAEMMDDFMDAGTNNRVSQKQMEQQFKQQMAGTSSQATAQLEKMLRRGLEIRVDSLNAVVPSGEIEADISLALKKNMTIAAFFPAMIHPSILLDIFYLNSSVRLPLGLTGENPALLNPQLPGMQTGLFEKHGEYLVHSAQTRDGKLFLNEKEFILQ